MHLLALKPKFKVKNFQITKLIGEGGFGLTYLAKDLENNTKVAIKEYLPSDCIVRKKFGKVLAKNETAKSIFDLGMRAFIKEARMLIHFNHPNIVKVYDYFLANGTAYIVMEYCKFGSLADKIYKQDSRKEIVIEDILAPIVYGLKEVHEHDILHLDIKPENILFRDKMTPVLIDFGAARRAIGDKSRHIKAIYTPGFAPLEQFSTDSKIGPGTDIYALAAVAYTCIKGEKPPSATDRILNDKIDKMSQYGDSSFYKSLDKALSLHLDDRPPTLSSWLAVWKPTNTQLQDAAIDTEINLNE